MGKKTVEDPVLFRPSRSGESWMMNACFMHGTWHLYATGYWRAANILQQWVHDNQCYQDTLVYPILFLWRQHVELRLKELVSAACALRGRPAPKKWAHGLGPLWKQLLEHLKHFEPKGADLYRRMGSIVMQLDQVDSDSQATRYPFRTNRQESFPPGTENLNLKHLHAVMNELAIFLDGVSAQFSVWRDMQTE